MATGPSERKGSYRRFLDLIARQPVSTDIWIALGWCVGILVVAYAFATNTYRHKIS